jgi:hypothetical protein
MACPYRVVRFQSQRLIANLKGEDFRRWCREWAKGGRTRRAQGAIRKPRSLLSYDAQERLPGCSQAREILSLIRFKAPDARHKKLDYAHAVAIELNRPSIALTQAIEWDTRFAGFTSSANGFPWSGATKAASCAAGRSGEASRRRTSPPTWC